MSFRHTDQDGGSQELYTEIERNSNPTLISAYQLLLEKADKLDSLVELSDMLSAKFRRGASMLRNPSEIETDEPQSLVDIFIDVAKRIDRSTQLVIENTTHVLDMIE